MSIMRSQRFDAHIAAGPGGRGVIEVPFDPDDAWGAKARHPVNGTINGRSVRGTIARGGSGWALAVTPMWLRDTDVAADDDVIVELFVSERPRAQRRRAVSRCMCDSFSGLRMA